ncbi:serpin family protein [Actinomarinicola tropica]|uniref:Serpin family protein n=1 Tax=Actinomarinicola tropica TaxID=2789776 RepID=A0A5Q2RPX4_9ACTN|nr:serpin family protein [Actinomarinicola tropica]QGG95940.1 serpin family protein [Actinomarinicola tropica]
MMRRRRGTRWLAAGLVLAVVVGACGGDDGDAEVAAAEVVEVGSDVPREPPAASVRTAPVVESDTAFAVDLYQALRADADGGNLFFSPYSITVALAMTTAGARGDTYEQLAAALGVSDADEWHAQRNALDQDLLEERHMWEGAEGLQPLELSIANSIWGQAGYPFDPAYLDLLASHYGEGLRTVDFIGAPEESRTAVNDWVGEATEGRITDLVPEGAITDLTRLVLANAIHFEANWINRFDPSTTRDGTFTTLSGDDVTVPTMAQEIRALYGEGDGWGAVRLPYAGEASMVLLVPDHGRFDDVVSGLDAATLLEVTRRPEPTGSPAAMSDHIVDLQMPRFEVASEIDLVPALERLGIVDLFRPPMGDDGADLTGITAARELFVSGAFHQANVTVDEEGTEASAATAMIISVTSAPPPATLHLDRPFVFVIQDDATGSILFIGEVTDPTAG